ncbi:MAG: FtsW/RodA/SpoVE family cell cycle protein, partial [Alistipes sp.]|nr:FtsW/RodA/SpoVE family cell cycle protein [Alistipes sp.]
MADKTRDNANAEAARTLLEKNRRIFEGDRTLWIIFTVLLVVSILVVYSSTAKMAYDISSRMTTTDSLRQQIMFVVLAIPTIFIVHKIDYKVFMRLTPLFYYIFIALTVATYFVGTTTNGAARWIAIGPIQFQPSEGLKILTILMLARRMESRQGNINKLDLLPTSWRLSSPKQQRIIRENTIPLLGPII